MECNSEYFLSTGHGPLHLDPLIQHSPHRHQHSPIFDRTSTHRSHHWRQRRYLSNMEVKSAGYWVFRMANFEIHLRLLPNHRNRKTTPGTRDVLTNVPNTISLLQIRYHPQVQIHSHCNDIPTSESFTSHK